MEGYADGQLKIASPPHTRTSTQTHMTVFVLQSWSGWLFRRKAKDCIPPPHTNTHTNTHDYLPPLNPGLDGYSGGQLGIALAPHTNIHTTIHTNTHDRVLPPSLGLDGYSGGQLGIATPHTYTHAHTNTRDHVLRLTTSCMQFSKQTNTAWESQATLEVMISYSSQLVNKRCVAPFRNPVRLDLTAAPSYHPKQRFQKQSLFC